VWFREPLFVIVGAALGWLLMFKYDQQFVTLLGGKLKKRGEPTERAEEVYRNQTDRWPPILASAGMAIMVFGVMAWGVAGIAAGIIGAAFWFAAIFIRIRSFQRADDELD
jgi:hypothetical protein